MRTLSHCIVASALLVVWTTAAPAQDLNSTRAISDVQLDAVRGGFDTGGGVLASFGIERATYINGQLVAHSQVSVPDIARITVQQAQTLALVSSTVSVIQNGMGNLVEQGSLPGASGATFIQNTLDHQNIQNLTTINASVNTLAAFRMIGLQESLQAGAQLGLAH